MNLEFQLCRVCRVRAVGWIEPVEVKSHYISMCVQISEARIVCVAIQILFGTTRRLRRVSYALQESGLQLM